MSPWRSRSRNSPEDVLHRPAPPAGQGVARATSEANTIAPFAALLSSHAATAFNHKTVSYEIVAPRGEFAANCFAAQNWPESRGISGGLNQRRHPLKSARGGRGVMSANCSLFSCDRRCDGLRPANVRLRSRSHSRRCEGRAEKNNLSNELFCLVTDVTMGHRHNADVSLALAGLLLSRRAYLVGNPVEG
jgi:hypothetical protein